MPMTGNPWATLPASANETTPSVWLQAMLSRNASACYLSQLGSPHTVQSFRDRVPLCHYEDLLAWLDRMQRGERDVLFDGSPIAWERTGGSSGGGKLIPYSAPGLLDFQHCLVPWLARTVSQNSISGSAYFSISPATRAAEWIGQVPIGLPDGAYLGAQAGAVLAQQSAVPSALGALRDPVQWREQTLAALRQASALELISVWSPTFLLRLLDDIPNPRACWPRLKLISCWTCGSAHRYAQQLQQRLPWVKIQPKGLLSTEGVVTVPGVDDAPVLVRHGFFEFLNQNHCLLESELVLNQEYEVVITTASGLYRYRTGDLVRFAGRDSGGNAILEFMGRGALVSDLVGEKLTERFVSHCLDGIGGFAMLIADPVRTGYVLVCERQTSRQQLEALEMKLNANPQYAYARDLGQLAPLRALVCPQAFSIVERTLLVRGSRLGDVKPLALRAEAFWLSLFEEPPP